MRPRGALHSRRRLRPWMWGVAAAYLVALVAVVLAPQPVPLPAPPHPSQAPHAGLRLGWLADVARNLLLFLPLGALAAGARLEGRQVIAIGFLLSLAIELLQLAIPGRFGSPVDLVANTLGAGIGAALVMRWKAWFVPSDTRASALSLGASAAAAGLLLTASLLLQPDFPSTTYYSGFTLELGHLASYEGRVLEASVGTTELVSSGPVGESGALRDALASGAPWLVRAVAGPPPASLAPLVTVHDQYRREILLVGIDGSDLVIRNRTRAAGAGLESPTARFRGALRDTKPADVVTIRFTPNATGGHVALDEGPPEAVRFSAGRSWTLLVRSPVSAPQMEVMLDALFIAALLFPASYWARRRAICWLGLVGLLALLLALPSIGPLTRSLSFEWIGALGGVVGGVVGSTWSARWALHTERIRAPGDRG